MAEPAEKKTSPAAMLIALGGLKKKPGAEGEPSGLGDEGELGPSEGDVPSGGEMKSLAAADAMSAMKAGDAAGFEEALTRFVEACTSEGYGK